MDWRVSLTCRSAILAAAENFTVLIKNSIMYPKFNFHRSASQCAHDAEVWSHIHRAHTSVTTRRCLLRRNILPHIGSSYLKSCEYNEETDPECPIFQLKYMVLEAGEDFQDMAVKVGLNAKGDGSFNLCCSLKSSVIRRNLWEWFHVHSGWRSRDIYWLEL